MQMLECEIWPFAMFGCRIIHNMQMTRYSIGILGMTESQFYMELPINRSHNIVTKTSMKDDADNSHQIWL